MRDYLFLFSRTMQSYGYDTIPLLEFCKVLRDRFIQLAIEEYKQEFITVRVLSSLFIGRREINHKPWHIDRLT